MKNPLYPNDFKKFCLILFEKVTISKDDLNGFEIEDMKISDILDDFVGDRLGIKEGYQILRINGKSVPRQDLKDFLDSDDLSEFEFEFQVSFQQIKCVCTFFETQPVEKRTVKLYRTKLHNERPEDFRIMRRQFPVRLTYAMTINKAQGIFN